MYPEDCTLSPKFIKKWMRVAKLIGEDQNPCHSRHIGAVVLRNNKILGTGYNGPAPGTPHPTSDVYLREYFWPQLTAEDKNSLAWGLSAIEPSQINDPAFDSIIREAFVENYKDKKVCPRRIVGAKSGEKSHLCSCLHAERNAITNAGADLTNAVMCAWCGPPCLQCCGAIIQAGIKEVYCLKNQAPYLGEEQTRWLFAQAGVAVFEHDEAWLLGE